MFYSYQIAPLLADERLEMVLEEFEPPAQPINIVYPHARLLPPRTKAFIDFFRSEISVRGWPSHLESGS